MKWTCKFIGFWLVAAIVIACLASPVFICWMDNGDTIIKSQCKTQEPVGNMCPSVCTALSKDCYLFHASKDLVRGVVASGEKMVLKHKDIAILNKEYVQSLLLLDDDTDQQESFRNLLQGLVTFEMNGNDSLDILNLLWPWQNSTDLFAGSNWPALEQILRFAHNDEYKLMQLHRDLHLFPAVLGTCGDVYAVQHVEVLLDAPLLDVLPVLTDTCHAARSAARILRYLRRLAATLPLHLCDLQWGHFGAAPDGRLRFVDLDAAFPASKMAATQGATSCATDADCDFFDCRGACDAARSRCRAGVSDNVSNLCRQLVWPRAPLLGAGCRLGLLGAVLREPEAELLERCARSRSAQHAQQVLQMLTELERRLCGAAPTGT